MSDIVKKPRQLSAQKRMENAKAELLADIYEKKRLQINGKYDFAVHSGKRKRVSTEFQSEEQILPLSERFTGVAYSRDNIRNTSSLKTFIKQFRNNVVGPQGGKVSFRTDNPDWNKEASKWFNSEYFYSCDFRSDLSFNDFLQIAIQVLKTEGDFLIVFDSFIENSGKLIFFENDQICNIEEGEWKQQTVWVEKVKDSNGKSITVPLKQESGVVYDRMGREVAYIATAKRGCSTVKFSEATIFPRSTAKLVRNRTRFNLLRGIPDSYSILADLQDILEMRNAELLSAKNASRTAIKVTKKDAAEDMLMKSGISPELLESASDLTTPATVQKDNYESLEAMAGGYIEYMNEGENAEVMDIGNRPSPNVSAFYDIVLGQAGASMGLADCYSKLKVSTSYTAFRGELLLSWQEFKILQKFIERNICDWVCEKSISWAIENGILQDGPEGWKKAMTFAFPVMPQINPVQEVASVNDSIKNGYMTYEDQLGSDWKDKLTSAAEQIQYAKEIGLPISAFETKAGAITDTQNIDTTSNTDTNTNNGDNKQ